LTRFRYLNDILCGSVLQILRNVRNIPLNLRGMLSVKGRFMDIEFVWATPTTTVPRDVLESKIREDVESDPGISPCHFGKITVHLSSNDPLEVTINGKMVCQCGKAFASLSGANDGSKLTYS
jgi:hypothetical protein